MVIDYFVPFPSGEQYFLRWDFASLNNFEVPPQPGSGPSSCFDEV